MKRYLSVFEMITRTTIYKVLAILILMVIGEVISLYIAWNQPLAQVQPNLEEWIDQSHMLAFFTTAYFLIAKVLSSSIANHGSMESYTLQRLRIPEIRVHILQCVYNVLCYVLLWALQLGVMLGASKVYMTYKTNVVLSNQTVFLAFYRNEFMHSILPLEDVFGWFLLLFFIVGTGVLAAAFSRGQRRGKAVWSFVVFLVMACCCFPRGLGEEPVLVLLIAFVWFIFWVIQAMLNKGVLEDESE